MNATCRLTTPLLCALALTAPAQAQQTGDDQRALEEVFVTVRKRVESMQEAPITVSAYGATALEEAGIANLKDLSGVVPNLDLQSGNGVNRDANPFIRGVGQRETRVTVDSGVGVYINGIYIARASGALMDLVDIEQVQVLRGPQGTLFGKNTTGGAIAIDTVKPGNETSGYVQLGGGNLDAYSVRGAVNLPLIEDKLAARLSLSSIRRDGFSTNAIDGRDFSDEHSDAAMLQLRWNINESNLLDVFASGTRTRVKPRGQNCKYVNDERGIPEGEALLEGAVNGFTSFNFKETCERSEQLGPEKFTTDFSDELPQGRDGRVDTDTLTVGITLESELGDSGPFTDSSLKQIFGYRNTRSRSDQDLDGTEIPLATRYEPEFNNTDQYSYELQFNGSLFDDFLNLTTGVFLFRETTTNQIEQSITLGPLAGNLAGTPALVLIGSGHTEREADNTAFSWFAQGDAALSEQLTLTLGLRWTHENRETAITETTPAYRSADAGELAAFTALVGLPALAVFTPADACSFEHINSHAREQYSGFSVGTPGSPAIHYFTNGLQVVSPTPTGPDSYTFCNSDRDVADISASDWTPMASLRYQLSDSLLERFALDDAMVFATYSEGFRSGVIVDGGGSVADDHPQLGGADREEVGFDFEEARPEQVKNYELGLKLDALSRRLRANMALFYMEYRDIQLTDVVLNPNTGGPEGVLKNAGGADFLGVELELTALLPWNLRLMTSFSATEADIQEFDSQLIASDPATGGFREIPIDRSDEPPPLIPDYQLFVSLIHSQSLQSGGLIDSGVMIKHLGETHRHFDRGSFESEAFISPVETFVDAFVKWTNSDDDLAVKFWVQNITNVDDYFIGGIPLVDFLGGGGQVYAEPRTYGLDLQYFF